MRYLMYEDDLPKGISQADYDEWFRQSFVHGNVRIGPLIPGIVVENYVTIHDPVDPANITDSTPPQATHHCPGCEAATRERDDLRAHPIICGCGDHIGYAEEIGLSQDGAVCGNCATSRKDYDARTELATLRARLVIVLPQAIFTIEGLQDMQAMAARGFDDKVEALKAELRALLAETEAKK